jgi:hypothetical protein
MKEAPKIKFNSGKVERLLKQIHEGRISEKNLPENLYEQIAEYLKHALYSGFGSDNFQDDGLLSDLRDNVYLFSAAKTYQFTSACVQQLYTDDGERKPFSQFYEEGKVLYGQYQENYAAAEYITVFGQAQMAKQWQTIEANKAILPMLTFSTNGMPCPECAPFEGLTAPVDDPIWDTCTPLLHFRCQCILIPSDDAEAWDQEAIDKLPIDTIPDDFQNNPGKTGEIFTKDNPYFEDVPKELAADNFGLEVPEEDE